MENTWLLGFTPALLALTAIPIVRGGPKCRSFWIAWCGLAATMIGDYFLAVKGSSLHSDGFLYGVAGFSFAQVCWIVFLRRHAVWSPRIAAALLFSLGILFGVRLIPALRTVPLAATLALYMLLSIISVSYACGTHSLSAAWPYGLCMFLFSDSMIAFSRILNVPLLHPLAEVSYLASLILIACAIAHCRQTPFPTHKFRYLKRSPATFLLGGSLVFLLFFLAMFFCSGPTYNPCMRMLSCLGRTRLQGVDYPACHYLFTFSLAISAGLAARLYPALSCFVKGARQKAWFMWGGALNAAGLLTIAFIPENVQGLFHNAGCVAAAAGGGVAVFILAPERNNPLVPRAARWGWLIWSCLLTAVFETFLLCHRFKLLPFAPYVPTCQKILILTFVAWLGYYAAQLFIRTRRRTFRPKA